MAKDKKAVGGLGIRLALLLFGFVPMITVVIILSIVNTQKIKTTSQEDMRTALETAAIGVREYFIYDVISNGEVDYDEYSDHEYIQSLQDVGIELTLFQGDTRFITSLKNPDGSYNEGSAASAEIYAAVSKGSVYYGENDMINGKAYSVCYIPMYDGEGNFWGMAFAGKTEAQIEETINAAVRSSILIAVISVAIFAVIIVWLAGRIFRALAGASKALDKLADGDIATKVNVVSSIKEITMIINSTDALQKQLSDSVGGAKQTAESLGRAVSMVDDLSKSSAEGTTQIAEAVNELATTAQSMAETVQDANTSVIEMGDAIDSIAHKAKSSAEDANDMKNTNKNASEVMDKVIVSNQKSVEAIQNIGAITKATAQAVQEIQVAADAITAIAGQTNLLSLNASIEAARAGEAGKGFAVVAGNIKNLAEESSNSAAEIGGYVEDIVAKVNKCVEASKEAEELMNQQNELVNIASESMQSLSVAVDRVAQNIGDIAESTDVLNTAKDNVLNNISDLSAISEENAASSQVVTTSVDHIASAVDSTKVQSQEMKGFADNLEEKMQFFRL